MGTDRYWESVNSCQSELAAARAKISELENEIASLRSPLASQDDIDTLQEIEFETPDGMRRDSVNRILNALRITALRSR